MSKNTLNNEKYDRNEIKEEKNNLKYDYLF